MSLPSLPDDLTELFGPEDKAEVLVAGQLNLIPDSSAGDIILETSGGLLNAVPQVDGVSNPSPDLSSSSVHIPLPAAMVTVTDNRGMRQLSSSSSCGSTLSPLDQNVKHIKFNPAPVSSQIPPATTSNYLDEEALARNVMTPSQNSGNYRDNFTPYENYQPMSYTPQN